MITKEIVENLERYGLCIVPQLYRNHPNVIRSVEEARSPFLQTRRMAGFTIPKGNNGGDKSSPPLSYCLEGACVRPSVCDMANHF
ncbi:ADQ_G0034280.mRNA.1.CDS.1 [Saccharomyces cerevisiae]|nr:ADQ_G0034280.mRNA.1.CDS.1 [Saccharomyces cerevisiae]CAI6782992.1 ADQ_G0034280.mRNA.1.CDS.1 [Saccharomyces cerevisiae]